MWSIYKFRRVIGGGCLACDRIVMAHGCDELAPWAQSEWKKYKKVLQN
jgi:hypothetical protein